MAAAARAESRGEVATDSHPPSIDIENRSLQLKGKRSSCYVCNQAYSELHDFYHMLCRECGDRCYPKREQTADLTGRVAVVTGGRIKIGFETSLKLLRSGCTVHITTRFASEAAVRFSEQADFEDWAGRLQIHRRDFRNLAAVLKFPQILRSQLGSLDILINNAAQSVKRSPAFLNRLLAFEENAKLTSPQQRLLGSGSEQDQKKLSAEDSASLENVVTNLPESWLIRDDDDRLDTREQNTWNSCLTDVDPVEILEVLLINANAPALLVRGLRELMNLSQSENRFIVNVSGADGTFSLSKSGYHPHVNMSKAALNMITRSCHRDFARDRIFINSVDTGWITHEGSFSYRQRRREQGFVPPFDSIDGAARVLDPVFSHLDSADVPNGVLFRNFQSSSW